jgi:hypothetical protein
MKRRRPPSRHRLSRDAEHLAWLAQGLADSGSRLEDHWWEGEIVQLVEKLLAAGDEDALGQALDRLTEANPRAYDELADLIEAACEVQQAQGCSRLLVALPILAWSRFAIPARNLPAELIENLRIQMQAHLLARGARVQFADYLFSPDQLPRGYAETRAFADVLWATAAQGRNLAVDGRQLAESQTFVSDVRYLLASVEVAAGQPVFRWNEPDGHRDAALHAWREQGGANLGVQFAGCVYELLLPDAYFAAWRRADRETRPFALKAAVAYLKTLFGVPSLRLRATVAPYFDRWLEEWRIGFGLVDSGDVVHGVTWPVLGPEDEQADTAADIAALLKAEGLTEIKLLEVRMPLEYCDDCGAPLFPNADGENVHAELPEDLQGQPTHLH